MTVEKIASQIVEATREGFPDTNSILIEEILIETPETLLEKFITKALSHAFMFLKKVQHRERMMKLVKEPVRQILVRNNQLILSKINQLRKPGFTEKSVGYNECIELVRKIIETN